MEPECGKKDYHYNDHHNDDDDDDNDNDDEDKDVHDDHDFYNYCDFGNDDERTFVSLTKVTITIVTKSDNYSSETEGDTLHTLTILSVLSVGRGLE